MLVLLKTLIIKFSFNESELKVEAYTFLYIIDKKNGKEININKLTKLIKQVKKIISSFKFPLNIRLYELLEDSSYLETAYSQIKEQSLQSENEDEFLNWPIQKMIIKMAVHIVVVVHLIILYMILILLMQQAHSFNQLMQLQVLERKLAEQCFTKTMQEQQL